ncbi:MAG: hypothetical protein ACP5QK_01370 [Myxococcota bacterium]
MKKFIFTSLLVLFLCLLLLPSGQIKADDNSITEFKGKLRIKQKVKDRISFIKNIKNRDIPEGEKLKTLLEMLEYEIKNPTEGYPPFNTYKPSSEFICSIIIEEMSLLSGNTLEVLKNNYKSKYGDLRDKLAIAIVSHKDYGKNNDDAEYVDILMDIAEKSTNLYTRSLALWVINHKKLYKVKYIPIYKKLLSDHNCLKKRSDVIMGGEYEYMNTTCPIRERARVALVELGIKVKRVKNEYYVIEDEER